MPWPIVPIGEIAEVVSGATPKTGIAEYWDGDVRWVTPADLSALSGDQITDTPRKISVAGLKSCAAQLLPPGSVLLSSRAPIGHVAINTVPMATNQGFKSLIPKAGIIEAKYLYHWLKANKALLQSLGNGATFKEVSKAVVTRVGVPLPPLNEQRRIADILDRADALRANRTEAIRLLDDLTQSIFLDMFGDAEHVWDEVNLDDVVDRSRGGIRTGPFGSQLLHSEFVGEGVAVLGIDNAVKNRFVWAKQRFIKPEKYGQLQRYRVEPGDVLITIMGTCGRAAVVPDDFPLAINTKHLCCITLDQSRCLPEYLHAYFLLHPNARQYLERNAKGAIMSGLNMGIIKNMPLRLPPLALQSRFVESLSRVAVVRGSANANRRGTEMLFESLQQRAFAGVL